MRKGRVGVLEVLKCQISDDNELLLAQGWNWCFSEETTMNQSTPGTPDDAAEEDLLALEEKRILEGVDRYALLSSAMPLLAWGTIGRRVSQPR